MKPLVAPLPYEIWTGWNEDRQVIHTLDIREADREFRRLEAEGKEPTIFLGGMKVRESRGPIRTGRWGA